MPQVLSTRFNKPLPQINQLSKMQPKHQQLHKVPPAACQNPLVSAKLISPDLVEILQPVNHDEKIKPPRVIIEECVLTETDWRGKIVTKHKEKKQKELRLKLFRDRKEIGKIEAAAKGKIKTKKTLTKITRPVEPTKSAEVTI